MYYGFLYHYVYVVYCPCYILGAMEFFSNRIKVTSKWSSSYSSQRKRSAIESSSSAAGGSSSAAVTGEEPAKMAKVEDRANFDGKM